MSDSANKLKLGALIALVVGSMVGGGIFSLPQNIANSAGAGATLIGWLITGVGMLTLAFVFQTLANRKPELDGGVYAYAKAGFGDYMGFSSAWGYWISAWIGNVSYMVLLFSTLGYFFPVAAGIEAGHSTMPWSARACIALPALQPKASPNPDRLKSGPFARHWPGACTPLAARCVAASRVICCGHRLAHPV